MGGTDLVRGGVRLPPKARSNTVLEPLSHGFLPNRNVDLRYGIGMPYKNSPALRSLAGKVLLVPRRIALDGA